MFTNRINIALPQQDWVEKTIHGVGTQWLSTKEKVPGEVVNKKGHADSVLGNEKTHHYWFPFKKKKKKKKKKHLIVLPIFNSIGKIHLIE